MESQNLASENKKPKKLGSENSKPNNKGKKNWKTESEEQKLGTKTNMQKPKTKHTKHLLHPVAIYKINLHMAMAGVVGNSPDGMCTVRNTGF